MLYLYYRTLGILVSGNIFVIDVTTFKHLFVANTNKFRNKVKSYFQRGEGKNITKWSSFDYLFLKLRKILLGKLIISERGKVYFIVVQVLL